MVMGVLSVVAFVLLSFRNRRRVLSSDLFISILMGVGAVFVWVNNTAKKAPIGMIEEQLPEAVELMVRSLARRPPVFASALQIVAKEVPDPLGTEMGVISDEAAYGRDVGDALKAHG